MLAHVAHHVSPVVGVPLPALLPSLGQGQGRVLTLLGLSLEMAWNEGSLADRGAGECTTQTTGALWQEPGL